MYKYNMISIVFSFISTQLNKLRKTDCCDCKHFDGGACLGGMDRYEQYAGMLNRSFEPKQKCDHEWRCWATVYPSRYKDNKDNKEKVGTKCSLQCNICKENKIDFFEVAPSNVYFI